MSSFSVHGKHVRNPKTWSRLGPIDFSAKIFTVCMDWVKLVGIIFWKTVVNTSRRNLKMWISRRRRRRWVLYLNDYGSNKEFREFGRRVHQRCQFRRVNDPDFLLDLLDQIQAISQGKAHSQWPWRGTTGVISSQLMSCCGASKTHKSIGDSSRRCGG